MVTPILSKPSALPLVVGALAFAMLYWLSSAGLMAVVNWWYYPAAPEDFPQRLESSVLWHVLGWALYLVPGFIAGVLARRSGLMHGALVGLLTAPIMAVLLYAFGFWAAVRTSSLAYGAILGVVWCSLAGFVGELIAGKVRGR